MLRLDPIEPSELDAALRCLLAPTACSPGATDQQVAGFRDFLDECPVEWDGWRAGPVTSPGGLFLAVRLPGSTAIVVVPHPGSPGIDPETQREVTRAGLEKLRRRRLHYAQSLLEHDAEAKQDALRRVGFRPMAPLVYLERDALYPWTDPPGPGEADWVAYGPQTHAEFARVTQATYADSQDCPELAGLRPMEDVLTAHKGSGRFEPQLWELAYVAGRPAGCVLLSRTARGSVVEVVYVGVVPAARGRGVGDLLLRRALEQCRRVRARRLTAVMDERNTPAQRLYARFAFATIGRREAYLYVWA